MSDIVTKLEKIAEELPKIEDAIGAKNTLEKIAFAVKALEIIDNGGMSKEAAVSSNSLSQIGGTMAKALVAGLGIGLAGEALDIGHQKVKKMFFERKLNSLAKAVKKEAPELKHTDDAKIKKMLEAGYELAPEVMENPTLAASFVSIGNSLGGKVDPNTMKIFADIHSKLNGRGKFSDNLTSGIGLI